MAKRKAFEYEPPKGPTENKHSQESLVTYEMEAAAPTVATGIAQSVFGLVFVAAGSFPFLTALNLIHLPGSKVHCPLFVLGSVGLAFMGAGLLLFFQGIGLARFPRLMGILGFITVMSFLTPFGWLAVAAPKIDLIARVVIGFFVGVIGLAIAVGLIQTIIVGGPSNKPYKRIAPREDDGYPYG